MGLQAVLFYVYCDHWHWNDVGNATDLKQLFDEGATISKFVRAVRRSDERIEDLKDGPDVNFDVGRGSKGPYGERVFCLLVRTDPQDAPGFVSKRTAFACHINSKQQSTRQH